MLGAEFMRSQRNGDDLLVRERVTDMITGMLSFKLQRVRNSFRVIRLPNIDRAIVSMPPSVDSATICRARICRWSFTAVCLSLRMRGRMGAHPSQRNFPPNRIRTKTISTPWARDILMVGFGAQISIRPTTTMSSRIAKDGNYFIHYHETQCRTLTPFKPARLKMFPLNYAFCGLDPHEYSQVGDALRALGAQRVASHVVRILNCHTLEACGVGRQVPQFRMVAGHA